jgi:hypothetical protein
MVGPNEFASHHKAQKETTTGAVGESGASPHGCRAQLAVLLTQIVPQSRGNTSSPSGVSVSSQRSWPPTDRDDHGREGGDQAGEIGLSPVSNSSYSGGNSIPKRWHSNLTSW